MPRVFVVPGHGAGDPGACAHGYSEAERVRALASRMKALGGDAVMLADFSRNYYADGGISRLDLPRDVQIVELHMDSGPASARGGHVVINGRYAPDAYDRAIASFLGWFMPGRAKTLVGRTDLANPNRAAARGYSYRLVECGFISNAGDLGRFNSEIDALAAGILAAFGIGEGGADMATAEEVWRYTYGDSDNCFNALHYASREILRRDDPTGRGYELTTHEHVKWIAAEQAAQKERLERIEAKLDALSEGAKTE